MLALLASAAFATPTFTGDAADVALANRLWTAGVICAGGRVPRTASVVPIERREVLEGYSGMARSGEDGLERIALNPDASSIVLAHEIGHAWFHDGPTAINEGRAEVFAECVAKEAPEDVRFYRGESLIPGSLSDLLAWGEVGSVEDRKELSALYSASWRLFRVLEIVIDRRTLWTVNSWGALDAELSRLGATGRPIRAALAGGAETQRQALRDDDLDGVVNLHEVLIGTRPDRWDTDGDGWWDGAPEDRPPHAVPVPRDGTPVCTPFVGRDDEYAWRLAGNLRGFDVANIRVPRRVPTPNLKVQFQRRYQDFHGGYWLQAIADDPVPSPWCAWHPEVTVSAQQKESVADLERLAEGVAAARTRFRDALGPAPARVFVSVVGEGTSLGLVEGQSLCTIEVPRRLIKSPPAGLFAQIVALARVAPSPLREPSAAAVALARAIEGEKLRPLTATFGADVKRFEKFATQCESGWTGLLAGDCGELYIK
ncbi:MAG: hypothetical protein AAF602_25750 [Myxococcota bacterium]